MASRRPADHPVLVRAARLYQIPGTTQSEVCERLGVSRSELKRAREAYDSSEHPRRRELVLASLTSTGLRSRGPWPRSLLCQK